MHTLQELMWPEFGICTEIDLYMRQHGPVAFMPDDGGVRFSVGGQADFLTWHNLFNLGRWVKECALTSLALSLEGEGRFGLRITQAQEGKSWNHVVDEEIVLAQGAPVAFDLSVLLESGQTGDVVYFSLTALSEGTLTAARWQTADAPRREPGLVVSVTTFRREDAVKRTVRRFEQHRRKSPLRDFVQLQVIDNGGTLDETVGNGVTILHNANLGGAGGFTRGLLEARRRGCSHCLFMDDDASAHMDAIDRAWTMLAYATDPRTAVVGAMISEQHRWAIWEYGATFFERCTPLHMGTDLRDVGQLLDVEYAAAGPKPSTFYGGWWFFAFPVDEARHLAFPFFVRGDDVSFSLKNDFNLVTMNGVASIQESFTEKESPQTWYLDLRSHLAHHLSIPEMDIGARGLCKITWWFFLRNLPRMHYETLAGISQAVEDVLAGPEFFEANADMSARRALFKDLTRDEAWVDAAAHPEKRHPVRETHPGWLYRLAFKLTLNGLLLPGFRRFGRKITLQSQHRGHVGHVWGAAEITVLSADRDKQYTVTHSKRRALQAALRLARLTLALARAYPELRRRYTADYDRLTSDAFWASALQLEDKPASSSAA